MRKNWFILVSFLAVLTLSSCEKERYMGPVDATGAPLEVRGSEGDDSSTSEGGENGVTDTGHGSDYDNTSNKRKKTTASN